MLWLNFLHLYQPANSDAYKIKEAADLSYIRIVKALEKNPQAKFTLNISACLVLRLLELGYQDLINRINVLIEKGQVELVGSAAYHALLPLLDDIEVSAQIKEHHNIIKDNFPKAKLRGFFLPEMAYSPRVAKLIKKLGYSWLILDEISYIGKKELDFNKVYCDKNSNLKIIFRSRKISNTYVPVSVLKILETEKNNKNKEENIVISACDAELFGLRHIDRSRSLEASLKEDEIKTMLLSKYVDRFKVFEKINLRESSWESTEKYLEKNIPFHLWFDKNNEIHTRLWKLANFAIVLYRKYQKDDNVFWSRWHLVRGLASCSFWWASAYNFKKSFGSYAWNPDEIERGADELIRAIRSLEKSSSRLEKIKAEEIFIAIKKAVWTKHWNENRKSKGNKISKLLDEKYVLQFFNKKVLPLYSEFEKIDRVKIIPHKNHIWESTYHVVLEFKITFSEKLNKNKDKKKDFSFFCTAHSSEPRKNVYDILKYLWDSGFASGFLTIPKPLFYSKYFNASFYRGVSGDSLLNFMKDENKEEIEKIIKKTAEWLAKLHKLSVLDDLNYNKRNNYIKTVIPGYKQIMKSLNSVYGGEYLEDIKNIYKVLMEKENLYLSGLNKRYLIHGDVHPENIIKMGRKKMAMIDFADICLSDFARDLGSFFQQLDYRFEKLEYPSTYSTKIKDLFLQSYCKKAKIKINDNLKERIDLYYNWTAIRTATFWLLKYKPDPERAKPMIAEVKLKLKLK